MRPLTLLALLALAAHASAHGVVTSIQGANGVTMPGLSVIDGTPRDCATPGCGAEADTSIIRQKELGTSKASALGRTEGGGPVDAAKAISTFVGAAGTAAATNSTATNSTAKRALGGLLGGGKTGGTTGTGKTGGALGKLLGGGAGAGASSGTGTKTPPGTVENGVASSAGKGATSGLPTVGADGTINMVYHQVNQDGAGPLTPAIDPTSGGTDPAAFVPATMKTDVPGSGVGGLSGTTATDFPITVQMPAGMTCDGTVAGVSNVCIVKVQNAALAGPFGGSAAFTQSPAAKKRALEYRMRKVKARSLSN